MTGLSAAGGSEDDPPKDEQVIEDAIRGSAGRKRVSLSRLAKDAHVQRQTIYNWFTGVAPEPETWGRVAARLDLPPLDQLLSRRRATETRDPLAGALSDLAAELAASRAERAAIEARLRAVEAELALRAQPTTAKPRAAIRSSDDNGMTRGSGMASPPSRSSFTPAAVSGGVRLPERARMKAANVS